tara:strand:- start:7013 stop:7282 length:270 start_codon:yes stop_codon:yes gene_type:complete
MDNSKTLENLRVKIENLDIFHQKEILKIFVKNNDSVTLNENKNGVLVNLTDVPENIINELNEYIKYVYTQEKQLEDGEMEKNTIKSSFF